jgi:NAD(P)-dependent dehydrogenase (short-subunit alcohol dehydrogenase family)
MNPYQNLFNLKDKVALVAGGAGAIGGEMAGALAAHGARIAIADRSQEQCDAAAARLGTPAMGIALNITDADSVAKGFAAVEQKLGPVDILVNAAGTHIEQPAEDVTLDAWDTVLNVNLRGAFILSQAAARVMIAHGTGGSHIHVTSVRSNLGIRRGYAAYCASKGGLSILIKQLATEWAKHGIRVNGIAPTFTRTPLVADYLNDPDFYNPLVSRIPMGRICETMDLAGIAIFLASPASSFITGQNIFVDGGVTASQ